ncbi:Transglycosylase SLT domain protein [compost metagenome]
MIAKTAISKALKAGGYPSEWLQPVLELVARESSFDPNNKNPASSAAGLFQFLNSTRKNYGGNKVDWSDPYQQAVQGLKYIKDRYSDPVKALKFWDERKAEGNAWY